jgi:NTE family protein
MWTRELTDKRNPKAILQMIMPKLFGFSAKFGMKSDHLAMKRFEEVYGDRNIEDLPIRLFITATDFNTGDQVVISRGRVVDAVRASISIPFIFEPYEVDGRLLTDGFVSDPLPVGVAMKEGANVIIAMGFDSPMQTNINSPARFGFQLSSIMSNNLLKSNFAFHSMAHHSEVIGIIPRFTQRVRLFDTEKFPYIIEEGERATEEQLPYLRRLLKSAAQEASA